MDRNGTHQFHCQCNGGFQGARCDLDVCKETECFNDGVCIAQNNDANNIEAQCVCSVGYFGSFCEQHICDDNKCLNGGDCIIDTSDPNNLKTQCACLNGFFGVTCERDMCSDITCFNGKCLIEESDSGIFQPKCNCDIEFVGEQCNIVKGCEGNPCLNDGICELVSTSYSSDQESLNSENSSWLYTRVIEAYLFETFSYMKFCGKKFK